ncbi:hypothetical protein L484_014832 [Morus notabilis]|uniref:Uncharacterized protein n=1 Tax=Morus notabilis TaxID=981085 RepID=W9QEQ6_9ROSA|nr:hypothetical protein L484_014832 [Morus notabilis]
MQGFIADVEPPNAIVNKWMNLLLSGSSIFFEDIWRNDVASRRSFLRDGGYNEERCLGDEDGGQDPTPEGVCDEVHADNTTTPSTTTVIGECIRMICELKDHIDHVNHKMEVIDRKLDSLTKVVVDLASCVSTRYSVHEERGDGEDICQREVFIDACEGDDRNDDIGG